jgi:hypothetical protein
MRAPGRTAVIAAAAAVAGAGLATAAWRSSRPEADPPELSFERPSILFDDFAEGGVRGLAANGWTVRAAAGEPGVAGATWGGVSLVAGAAGPGGRLLRLEATTDGTAGRTVQAQVCRAAGSRDGTSAARIRLRDEPVSGPAVDGAAQLFAAFGPVVGARGEFSFTYRSRPPRLEVTSPDGTARTLRGTRAGWHVLLAQVTQGRIDYFVDGRRVALRRGRARGGAAALTLAVWLDALGAGPPRRWTNDVDWVFHQADVVLSPRDVAAAVDSLRRIGIGFEDTTAPGPERAGSPCAPG